MKQPRPHRRSIATIVGAVAAICFSGCHNQQTALTNPFMAPDRVPPPSTRAVAPGTAQPYYPGDPLPAPQASAAPAADTTPIAATTSPAPNTPTTLAYSNERTVAVPADDSSLRFALPAPPPTSVAASSPSAAAPAPPATAPSTQFVAQTAPSAVIPASYTSPTDPYRVTPTSVPDATPNGPWRAPQMPASLIAVAPAYYSAPTLATTSPLPSAPVAGPTIPVTLRAVPSPTADATVSQPPRIRFPSYDATTQVAVGPNGGPVQQAAFVSSSVMTQQVVASQSPQPQTVAITPLPTSGVVPGLGPAVMPSVSVASQPQSATTVSPDGFRPRSTLR